MARNLPVHLVGSLFVERDGAPSHIAAASGLAVVGAHLVVVADDELHLGVFPFPVQLTSPCVGKLVRLVPGTLPDAPKDRKQEKPDHEAIVSLPDGALLVIPSGSRPSRTRGALVRLTPTGELATRVAVVDFAPLFGVLCDQIGPLNIEGGVVFGDRLLLFQRGLGADAINGIVSLDLPGILADLATPDPSVTGASLDPVLRLDLGHVGRIPLTFTDAAVWGERIIYTAAAEATTDAYDDGPIGGSVLGVLGQDFEPLWQAPLGSEKFEGVAVTSSTRATAQLLLVTDADDRSKAGNLYRATLAIDLTIDP